MRERWGLLVGAILCALALAACGSDDSRSSNSELFTTAGFTNALDAVKGKAGGSAEVLRVQITDAGAEFTLRNGDQASGYFYSGGELHDEKVEMASTISLEGEYFPISDVDPASIDRLASAVQSQQIGNSRPKVTVLKLDKQNAEGIVKWSIVAEADHAAVSYTADPDGSNVSSLLGDIAGAGQ